MKHDAAGQEVVEGEGQIAQRRESPSEVCTLIAVKYSKTAGQGPLGQKWAARDRENGEGEKRRALRDKSAMAPENLSQGEGIRGRLASTPEGPEKGRAKRDPDRVALGQRVWEKMSEQ